MLCCIVLCAQFTIYPLLNITNDYILFILLAVIFSCLQVLNIVLYDPVLAHYVCLLCDLPVIFSSEQFSPDLGKVTMCLL